MTVKVIHCSIERLPSKVWQRQQSRNVQNGKEGTLQVAAVVAAVHHLWMMSLQKGEKQQTLRPIQTLSKKHSF